MLAWIAYWTWWFAWRIVITLACLYTIQHVISAQEYRVEMNDLIIIAICAILALRFWMPSCNKEKDDASNS